MAGETLRLDGGRAVPVEISRWKSAGGNQPVEINGAGAVALLVEVTFRLTRTAST